MKHFGGRVLFLDRSDINTDEIIPARYLTENAREDLKPWLLEDHLSYLRSSRIQHRSIRPLVRRHIRLS